MLRLQKEVKEWFRYGSGGVVSLIIDSPVLFCSVSSSCSVKAESNLSPRITSPTRVELCGKNPVLQYLHSTTPTSG